MLFTTSAENNNETTVDLRFLSKPVRQLRRFLHYIPFLRVGFLDGFPNDVVYKGQFKDNEYHGEGCFYHPVDDTLIFKGIWENGILNGFGTYYADDGTTLSGHFINGECIENGKFFHIVIFMVLLMFS
jgi:hypothetical protein